ncbi:MAG: hypothetical protein U0234_11410 [Sandaracinus sp.]
MSLDKVELFEDHRPLVVVVSPAVVTAATIDAMASAYERLFQRGRRYASISVSRRGGATVGARERRAIAEWANSPRVREMSKELCVGSSTIVEGALQRAALTAIQWFWTPIAPHRAVATAAEAVDFCHERLKASGLTPIVPRESSIAWIEKQF